jgi:tetratricopeptide (TPR) repeat protein
MMAPGKLMMQEAKTAAASRKKTEAATKSHGHASAASYQPYQSAVQLVQQGKYEKALAALEKLLPSATPELVERCRMYITTCQRQLEKSNLQFSTPEERYDYAVSQLNQGFYEEAREQLAAVVNVSPGADYAFYGLAVLDSITGRPQECLGNLGRAIELNQKNRLQARSDGDFQNMADDPRFTELLYPEVP